MKYSLQKVTTNAASLLVCFAVIAACSTAQAQERTLFGGVGIPDMSSPQQDSPRFELPRLFSPRENSGSASPATPAINWPDLNPFNNQMAGGSGGNGLFGGEMRLFPPMDPNRPRPFENFGQKSREFFDQTAQNFNQTADNINQWARDQHQRNTEAWQNLTQNLRPRGLQSETPQTQPQLRSADLMGGSGGNRVRF
ncbi:MAG: hypothetical protein AAF456_12760 [Planctomycetota bacterium]